MGGKAVVCVGSDHERVVCGCNDQTIRSFAVSGAALTLAASLPSLAPCVLAVAIDPVTQRVFTVEGPRAESHAPHAPPPHPPPHFHCRGYPPPTSWTHSPPSPHSLLRLSVRPTHIAACFPRIAVASTDRTVSVFSLRASSEMPVPPALEFALRVPGAVVGVAVGERLVGFACEGVCGVVEVRPGSDGVAVASRAVDGEDRRGGGGGGGGGGGDGKWTGVLGNTHNHTGPTLHTLAHPNAPVWVGVLPVPSLAHPQASRECVACVTKHDIRLLLPGCDPSPPPLALLSPCAGATVGSDEGVVAVLTAKGVEVWALSPSAGDFACCSFHRLYLLRLAPLPAHTTPSLVALQPRPKEGETPEKGAVFVIVCVREHARRACPPLPLVDADVPLPPPEDGKGPAAHLASPPHTHVQVATAPQVVAECEALVRHALDDQQHSTSNRRQLLMLVLSKLVSVCRTRAMPAQQLGMLAKARGNVAATLAQLAVQEENFGAASLFLAHAAVAPATALASLPNDSPVRFAYLRNAVFLTGHGLEPVDVTEQAVLVLLERLAPSDLVPLVLASRLVFSASTARTFERWAAGHDQPCCEATLACAFLGAWSRGEVSEEALSQLPDHSLVSFLSASAETVCAFASSSPPPRIVVVSGSKPTPLAAALIGVGRTGSALSVLCSVPFSDPLWDAVRMLGEPCVVQAYLKFHASQRHLPACTELCSLLTSQLAASPQRQATGEHTELCDKWLLAAGVAPPEKRFGWVGSLRSELGGEGDGENATGTALAWLEGAVCVHPSLAAHVLPLLSQDQQSQLLRPVEILCLALLERWEEVTAKCLDTFPPILASVIGEHRPTKPQTLRAIISTLITEMQRKGADPQRTRGALEGVFGALYQYVSPQDLLPLLPDQGNALYFATILQQALRVRRMSRSPLFADSR